MTKDGVTDTIGLSISDYDDVRAELQPIFFGAGPVLLDAETILTNIAASEYLNNGWELAGNETKGYVLYAEGTSATVLEKAYWYLGETYAPAIDLRYLNTANYTNLENYA